MEMILLIVFGSIGVGFALILLLAIADKKQKKNSFTKTPEEEKLSHEQFGRACFAIIEGMKLDLEEVEASDYGSLDIIAKNPTPVIGGTFIIHCRLTLGKIDFAEIAELSNQVIQERASKGIFITTGSFSLEPNNELAPIEFIDRNEFLNLLKKFAPDIHSHYVNII